MSLHCASTHPLQNTNASVVSFIVEFNNGNLAKYGQYSNIIRVASDVHVYIVLFLSVLNMFFNLFHCVSGMSGFSVCFIFWSSFTLFLFVRCVQCRLVSVCSLPCCVAVFMVWVTLWMVFQRCAKERRTEDVQSRPFCNFPLTTASKFGKILHGEPVRQNWCVHTPYKSFLIAWTLWR